MAVRFDASTDDYTRNFGLSSIANYTQCGWVKIATDRNDFSTAWDWGAGGVGLTTDSDGTTMKVWDDGVGSFVATGPNMTVGTWYFLAYSVSGTSATLYWRTAAGTSFSTATWTGASRTHNDLRIGDNNFSEWLNGGVAAIKFWNAGLSADELWAESTRYVPNRTSNLQAFYPFVNAETADYSGNGRTLTAGSTATTTEDGPPIPWRVAGPRLTLPASSGGSSFTQNLSGAAAPAGALTKQGQKLTAGSAGPAGAVAKQAQKRASSQATPTGALLKLAAKALTASTTPAGVLATTVVRLLTLAGSTTPTGALRKSPAKAHIAAATPAATLTRTTTKTPAGSTTPVGALSKLTGKRGTGQTTPAGALGHAVVKLLALAGQLTPSGALTRRADLAKAGQATPAGTAAKAVAKTATGSTAPTGTPAKLTGKRHSGTATTAGALLKLLSRSLGGTTAPTGAVTTSTSGAPPSTPGTMTAAVTTSPSMTAAAASGPTMHPAEAPAATMRGT